MKPVIGILPSYDKEKGQIFLDNFYIEETLDSGGIPFIIPFTTEEDKVLEILEKCVKLYLAL